MRTPPPTGPWSRAVLISIAALTPVLLHAVPAHAEPAIDLDRASVRPGQTVTVRLTGWEPGNLLVELCGNEARRGTADCAVASSASTYAQQGRAAVVMLNVAAPPVGCPCVIAVRPVTGGAPRTVPITVDGVPALTAAQRRTATATGARRLTATRVSVHGGGPGEAWFGGSGHRTLRVTLRNEGTAALTDPPLSLAVGRGPEPTGVAAAPALGTLTAGQERTYDIPFSLPAPAFGRYTVRGEITGLDEPIAFTAATASYPWGLPLLGALLVPLPLLARRRKAVPAPAGRAVPSADGRPRTANEVVAANVAWWARLRGLTAEDVAGSLASLTGRPRTAAELPPAVGDCSFDADDLTALSEILDVPLPALLLPGPPGRTGDTAVLPAVPGEPGKARRP